jgi:hypothetical protein
MTPDTCPLPCHRARLATLRRPEWGDIVAPPDVVELPDGMGSDTCSRALYIFDQKDET